VNKGDGGGGRLEKELDKERERAWEIARSTKWKLAAINISFFGEAGSKYLGNGSPTFWQPEGARPGKLDCVSVARGGG
jgi:hypothetical protein